MTWSLATYQRNGTIGLAALRGDGTLVAPPDLKRWTTMLELMEDWAAAEGILAGIEVADAPAVELRHAAGAAAVAAQGRLRGRQLPPARRRDGRRDPCRGLAAVLLPQAPDHDGHRADRRHRRALAGDRPVRLGSRAGRGHRHRRPGHPGRGRAGARGRLLRGQRHHRPRPAQALGGAGDAFIYDWFASKSVDGSLPLGPGITPGVPDPRPAGPAAAAVGERRARSRTSPPPT